MLTSIRSLTAATLLASTLLAAPAFAQDESDITVSGSVALVSEYRFRGVDLSDSDPAIQGSIGVSHSSGLYVGTWASSLDESTGYGHTEIDFYAGWKGEVTPGVTLDAGATYYYYPNAVPGDFDVIEFYTKAGFGVGPASLTLGAAYSPKQDSLDFGGPRDNVYVSADLGLGIPETPISLLAHAGYTDGALTYTANSKAWDWSLGASAALGSGVSLGAAYTGVEGTGTFADDAFVFTLSAGF
ncbi:MAG: TorF family putative porin [Pseudomonadota bacterium]